MKPLISVVLPVWNGARWLTEAIDSIRRQTHDNFELVVVDDGSTDGSADIFEASARSDSRIRTFRQERNGLVVALNRGLSEAQGQLIARLDADDRAHPQRLQKQTEYLDQYHDVGLVGSWAELIDEQGSIKGFRKYRTRPESLKPLLPRTNPLLHSSIMVRRSVLQKVGLYRPAFEGAEDYDLWLRVSEITKIANLPEYLVQYRLHTTNITHRHRVRQLFSARLAQRAAHLRQTGKYDPTSELTTAPNWRDTEVLKSPIYGDIARLFRFLELGDSVELTSLTADQFDAAALNESDIVLNHAERRMAQLALLNLLRQGASLRVSQRIGVLWNFVRLHPPRAAQLGYQLLHGS